MKKDRKKADIESKPEPSQASMPGMEPEPANGSGGEAGRPYPAKEPTNEAKRRISIPITSDGLIDTGSLRTSTAADLREVLSNTYKNPETRKWVGIASPTDPTAPKFVTPAMFGGLWDIVAQFEANVFAARLKAEQSKIYDLIKWTETEHIFLDNGSEALVNKYCPPEWMEKGADAAFFLTSVMAMMALKFKMCQDRFGMRDASKPSEPVVQPASKSETTAEADDPTVAKVVM